MWGGCSGSGSQKSAMLINALDLFAPTAQNNHLGFVHPLEICAEESTKTYFSLGGAVSTRISKAKVLWIEADPVFGGSLSQVQFPVELSGFFYLPRNPRFGAQTRVGVSAAGVDFSRKKMDFHHNQMWRLNLPTKRQGFGAYVGKILAFERTAQKTHFRLWPLEKRSALFRKLRARCRAKGKVGSTRREDGRRRAFGFC